MSASSSSRVLHLVKARHAYNTTVADQMAFAAGESMHIVAKNGGWWMAVRVSNPAERGWVPSNYLSVVDEATGALEKVQVTPRTQAGQVRPDTVAGSASVLASIVPAPVVGEVTSVGAEEVPNTGGKSLLYAVRALHRFTPPASQADGLAFERGDVLAVVGEKDGWLRARHRNGNEGFAPSNYVKRVEVRPADGADGGDDGATVPAASAISPAASAAAEGKDASEKEQEGEAEQQNGSAAAAPAAQPTKLLSPSASELSNNGKSSAAPQASAEEHPQGAPSPRPDVPPLDPNMTPRLEPPTPRAPELPTDSYVATPRSSRGPSGHSGSDTPEEEYRDQVGELLITPRMAQSIGAPSERVRANFNFDAKKPDHLSFKKGDVMVVLKKKAGWWKVHHEGASGRMGYIPANYVTPIKSVDPLPNPTTTLLTAAGLVVQAPVDFEPSKDRPLLVKASHSYKALANNQLSFQKHDLLHVIHKNKGWWKAYRVADVDKIGYIPSNYVKVQGPAPVSTNAEGAPSASSSSGEGSSASTAAAAAPVEMEEFGVALHDLERKDPKCLPLKRDERFSILDRQVGGGWWKATSLTSGETGLVPSNFLRLESAPKRQPPALPGPRGSVADAPTYFAEGGFDFAAKKSSQLPFRKHDPLVLLRKEGSWWKARNRLGNEGVVPYNYVKEVTPSHFVALWDFHARDGPGHSEELSIRREEVLTVLDSRNPAWWHCQRTLGEGEGWVPARYLHPLSSRAAGAYSAPSTPRSSGAPEVPSTPRNPDGSVRADPPVATARTAAAAEAESGEPQLRVELGDASQSPSHARRLSGTLSSSPLNNGKESALLVDQRLAPVASVVAPAFASPEATPRPEFLHEKHIPARNAPRVHSEGVVSAPATSPQSLSNFFDRLLPSAQGQLPSGEPAVTGAQVEGAPAASASSVSAPSSAAAIPYLYQGEEGEGEEQPQGGTKVEEHKETNDTLTGGSTSSGSSGGGVEIGSAADPRTKSTAGASPEARSCATSGWQSFFGVFAACTGANREEVPKPAEEEKQPAA